MESVRTKMRKTPDVNQRKPVRTLRGSIPRRSVIDAWTRTKIAKNIKIKSKTPRNRTIGTNSNNTREMAVSMRRMFTYTAPRGKAPVLYRGLPLNSLKNIRTHENGPTSWTNSLSKAKIFAFKNKNKPGVILRLVINNNVPFIRIKPNPRMRYSHLGEHILPPGNFSFQNVSENKIHNVKFRPDLKYLKPWTFY